MDFRILTYLAMILIFSDLSHQQTTPEKRCELSGGGFVCMDCFRRGSCILANGIYTVVFDSMCTSTPSQTYCDDTLFNPGTFGTCSPLTPSATSCSCSSATRCIADPNNAEVVLHCEASLPFSDEPCSAPVLNLTTCSCASCPVTCPLLDDPNDNCAKYYVCSGSQLFPVDCTGTSCFDQASCACIDTGVTTPLTCPADCPFVDDPNDNCSKYFVCNGNELIPATCPGDLCFNQELCSCSSSTSSTSTESSTKTTTLGPLTCPPGCSYVDDPNDNCSKFYFCDGDNLIQNQCPGVLCFDQAKCACA